MISEIGWSLLDDRPVMLYSQKYDAHLCAWNGVLTTRRYAMLVQALNWYNIYPTESMKLSAWGELTRLHGMGAFDEHTIDMSETSHQGYHSFLSNKISPGGIFFSDMRTRYTPQQTLAWFKGDREIRIA